MHQQFEENVNNLETYRNLKNFLESQDGNSTVGKDILDDLSKFLYQSRLMYDTLELISQGKLSESKSNSRYIGTGYVMKTNRKYAEEILESL